MISNQFEREVAIAVLAFLGGMVWMLPPSSLVSLVGYVVRSATIVFLTAGIYLVGNLIVSEVRARVTA